MGSGKKTGWDRLIVLLAQGLGIGRAPVAPGTFGTLLGFGWIALLLLPGSLLFYLIGTVAGFFLAVWIGGRAEKALGLKDPGSIVIDEIMALPVAFLAPVISSASGNETLPFEAFLAGTNLLLVVATFAAFRFFDITKPLGIARVQDLRGGWGLVADDFLAAAAACPVVWLVQWALALK